MGVTKRPRIVGHRGAPLEATENTLAAIEAAARLGADGVEVDLRLSGDGTVVVIHDDDVLRTMGVEARVRDVDAQFLADLGVPTMAGLLAACERLGLWINLEVKEAEPGIAAAIGSVALPHGGVVSSFLPHALDLVAAAAPHVPRALLTLPGSDPALAIEAAAPHGGWNPFFLTILDDPGCVRRARDRGLSVHTWTVDDPSHVREVAAAGVDSVITNVPAQARKAIASGS